MEQTIHAIAKRRQNISGQVAKLEKISSSIEVSLCRLTLTVYDFGHISFVNWSMYTFRSDKHISDWTINTEFQFLFVFLYGCVNFYIFFVSRPFRCQFHMRTASANGVWSSIIHVTLCENDMVLNDLKIDSKMSSPNIVHTFISDWRIHQLPTQAWPV